MAIDLVGRVRIKNEDERFADIALVMTVSEVSQFYGVPPTTIRYWCSTGFLVASQRGGGGTWLISTADVKLKLTPRDSPVIVCSKQRDM